MRGRGVWVPAFAGTTQSVARSRSVNCIDSNFKQRQPQLRDLAADFARVLSLTSRPLQSEGAGNAGRPMRPIAACAMIVVERTRVSQVTPESPGHSPRSGFNGFLRALPGDRAFLPPSPLRSLLLKNFDASVGASGPHDFSVRFQRRRLRRHPRPPHPLPRFVTLRNAPPQGQDGKGYRFDLG